MIEGTSDQQPGASEGESRVLTTAAGTIARLSEAISDRLNPILVKETRQALKSKQFSLWFVLLLIACWVTTIGAIAWIGPSIYYLSAGGYLLFVYYVILALPLTVVVPFSAYRSLSSEHEDNTNDLLEVSSLTPRQVVDGKLGSAALQIAIYLSALAPCIAFTYLLRGVGLMMILLLLAYAVMASIGLSAIGLVLAASSRQKYSQVVMSVAFAGVLFGAFIGLVAAANVLRSMDPGVFASEGFFWFNAMILSLFLTTFAVVYAAAISLTTFTAANRSTPLRYAIFVQQAVYVAWIAGGLSMEGVPSEVLVGAFVIAAIYWFIAGALLTGESPSLSMRVRRSLPQSWLGRAVGTWFNPGGGSGYVFAMTNLVLLAALAGWWLLSSPRISSVKAIVVLTAYVAAYLGFGRLTITGIRRLTEVSLIGSFLIQILLALAGSSLPYVADTISSRIRVADIAWLNVWSPTWNVPRLLNDQLGVERELMLFITLGAVTLAIGLVNLALAGHEARQLRIAAPRRVLEDDAELNPAPEAQPTNPWGDRREPAPEVNG